jgi:hypothetical protein
VDAEIKVQFVCVRGSHHRQRATTELCEYLGRPAYCPSGEVGGHEWLATATDFATLARLGYVPVTVVDPRDADREDDAADRPPVLIR